MAWNFSALTIREFTYLLNHAGLGHVTTWQKVRNQIKDGMNDWTDGRQIDFLKYVRWAAQKVFQAHEIPLVNLDREKELQLHRLQVLQSQNIGPRAYYETIVNPERRAKTISSLKNFLEYYFPEVVFLHWSTDHLKVIQFMERAIREGGLFAFAMPRGSGKTTLLWLSALWAVLGGYRRFVCLIGANRERSVELLTNIKKAILQNSLLAEDYKKPIVPLQRLENNARRQIGQHIDGQRTYPIWGTTKLVFPTVSGPLNEGCGAVISTTSLDANFRGQQHLTLTGEVVRPDLVLLDDPQTRESAFSPKQTQFRLQLLQNDVLGLGGPGRKIAAFLACTKITQNDLADQILNRDRFPEWHGVTTKLVYQWPNAGELWDKYLELRRAAIKQDLAPTEALNFYIANREAMEKGAIVAWPDRFDKGSELSAIQHAYHLRSDIGEEAFMAEYQNSPVSFDNEDDLKQIRFEGLCERLNRYEKGVVPLWCDKLTAYVDPHASLIYWLVVAWRMDFTGAVVDYGTIPQQTRSYFSSADAKKTLQTEFKGFSTEASIYAALELLSPKILGRAWQREDGVEMHVARLLVDANWGLITDRIYAWARQNQFRALILPAHGRYFGAASLTSRSRALPKGRLGDGWVIPTQTGGRQVQHVIYDTNYWKSFVRERLHAPVGGRGAITFWGKDADQHRLFFDHLQAEHFVSVEARGVRLDEWRLRPGRVDNHWWDCLVGAAVAASIEGVSLTSADGNQLRSKPVRKKLTQADINRYYVAPTKG